MARRTKEEQMAWANKKTQIISSHSSGGDWRSMAADLSVPLGTAYRWVSQGNLVDSRGGNRFNKVTDEHVMFMTNLIERNPRITLQGIVEGVNEKFGFNLSKTTIWRHLDNATYTLKKVRFEPERANTYENKVKRKEFVEKLLFYQASNMPIYFIDESNFNIHISRIDGRSLRGTRCTTIAAGSKDANIHIIGCMCNAGLLYTKLRRERLRGNRLASE